MSITTAPTRSAVMEFPSGSGAKVTVFAVNRSSCPYSWVCSAGHQGDHSYASLPFCRDDAKAHAAECPARLPAASRPVRTPELHYAAARSAENVARGLSLRFTVRSFTGGFADDVHAVAVERAELKAARDSYSLLAAAHRAAARRLQRGRRLRLRAGLAFGPVVRVASEIRWAVRRVVA